MSNVHLLGRVACLLLAVAVQQGCSKTDDKKAEKPAAGDKHAHPETGPHKGQLIELGKEEYHAELVHDDAAHKVTVYLLDGAAKKSVAVTDKELGINLNAGGKPQQFKLPAVPQADDAAGSTSRFELVDKEFCEALDDEKTTGRLNITIAGKVYSGDIKHAEHGEHGHK